MNRRKFLKRASKLVGASGAWSAATNLQLMSSAMAQTQGDYSDYKAMICLFLPGGMDSFNVLVPGLNHGESSNYDSNRDSVKLDRYSSEFLGFNAGDYGVHGKLGAVKDAYDGGDLAFLANVGSLVKPVSMTEVMNAFRSNDFNTIPVSIGAHNTQQEQWQTLSLEGIRTEGWLSRLESVFDSNSVEGMSFSHIAIGGHNFAQAGGRPAAFNVGSSLSIKDLDGRIKDGLEGIWEGYGCTDFQKVTRNAFESTFAQLSYNNSKNLSVFSDALDELSDYSPSIEFPTGAAILEPVFKSMLMGADEGQLNLKRQTFFISLGSWDHHKSVEEGLNENLEALNEVIGAFKEFIDSTGINATLFTASDFGRTLAPNNPDSSTRGTDHAWGGNQMIIGSDVDGGKVFGDFPELSFNPDPLDINSGYTGRDYTTRGRIVPTTSLDEYYAELAKWFGVADSELGYVLPNLANFDDNPYRTNAINFMNI